MPQHFDIFSFKKSLKCIKIKDKYFLSYTLIYIAVKSSFVKDFVCSLEQFREKKT